jgi:hypothetical protein
MLEILDYMEANNRGEIIEQEKNIIKNNNNYENLSYEDVLYDEKTIVYPFYKTNYKG